MLRSDFMHITVVPPSSIILQATDNVSLWFQNTDAENPNEQVLLENKSNDNDDGDSFRSVSDNLLIALYDIVTSVLFLSNARQWTFHISSS